MSIEASEWARRQWVGDAHGKSLLRAIADYAGEEGACFPSLKRLSRDCEFSEDTVRRKLRSLEEDGLLVRIKSWMDEHGRRNTEGRGRETSHEIRLLLKRPPNDPPREEPPPDDDEGLQPARVAACEPSTDGGGGVAVVQPPNEPSLEEVRTPNPLAGGVQDSELSESFKPFQAAYPAPITDMGKALSIWAALSETERLDALTGARGYRAYIEAERIAKRNRAVKDAHRWLRDKLWLGYLKTGKDFEAAESAPKPTFVPIESPEGKAALALHAIARSPPQRAGDQIKLNRPLTPQALALADAPPRENWPLLDLPQQAGAWLELMQPLIGRGPLVEDHIVGKRFVDGPDGKPMFAGNDLRKGFRAPWPFPPRVDGTLPPMRESPALSASDIDDFTK